MSAGKYAGVIRALERRYDEDELAEKGSCASGQAHFQSVMESLSKSHRHRYFRVVFGEPGGYQRVQFCDGTDIWCGCDAHPTRPTPPASTAPEVDERELAIARRSAGIDANIARATSPLVAVVLRLRFREPLPYHLVPFGLDREDGERGRPMVAAIGVSSTPARGHGNLAHLVEPARSLPNGRQWVNNLGRRLQHDKCECMTCALAREDRDRAGGPAAGERETADEIERRCEELGTWALEALQLVWTRASTPRLHRAGLGRVG